ncbi:MAG: AAA family ATPase [Bacteroidetes bacterium]|nr:AAA family ATPase [Bacteroidota bacterium]
MRIIGITGTIGSGKGTIVDYLVKHHGFTHFSVRGYLTGILNQRGLTVNRDTMVMLANELRAANSPSFIAEELYRVAKEAGKECIIESIRTVGEITSLRKQENFYLFAVDADQKLRYTRIVERASETDKINFETFVDNELREMTNTDPNKQNLDACMRLADFTFLNNGSFDDLYRQIDTVLERI